MTSEGDFKLALARLAGGVAVISSRLGSHDHAMTASALCSVSLDPPLVLVCVEIEARFHDAVSESGALGISLLTTTQRAHADWLATPGRPIVGQLDGIAHRRGASGAVLLDGSLATLDCHVVAMHPAGDHSIVVAQVDDIVLADEPGDALVYYRHRFGSLA